MKLFLLLLLFPLTVCADITIKTTDLDKKIMEMRVTNADQWIQQAWNNKVSNCKKWLINEYTRKCLEKNTPIPQSKEEILNEALKEMKTRKQLDDEQKIK